MDKIIVTAILVIGGVAAVLVVVFALGSSTSNSSQSVATSQQEDAGRTKTSIDVIAVAVRPGGLKIDAWVKNTSTVTIEAIERSDLFLIQPGTRYDALTYNDDGATSKTWYGDLKEAGLPWNRGDTLHIIITMSCVDFIPGPKDFALRMSTPNGIIDEEIFGSYTTPKTPKYYLHNNPTPPTGDTASQAVLPLDPTSPTAATRYNYDTDRDFDEGLHIAKGGSGPTESILTKTQAWRTAAFPAGACLIGTATITLWAAIKDYGDAKAGEVTAYLRDYNGSTYTEIGNGTVFKANWQEGSGTFVQETITIPGLSYTIPVGNMLEIKMIVTDNSDDDMWFAYDTSSYPTEVQLP